MSLATQVVDPAATTEASVSNGTAAPSTPPDAQAPASTPAASAAPETPVAQQPPADDWKAKHDRLITESIPKLQSDRDTAKARVTELEAKVAEYETKLRDMPDIEELTFQVGHERDLAFAGWLRQSLNGGATLQQVVAKLERQVHDVTTETQQLDAKRKSLDGLIGIVEGYDAPFAKFLRAMDANGSPVTQQTIPNLRKLYDELGGGKAAIAQATEAASAAAAPAAETKTPPVSPAPGGAKVGDAPVWSPGMRSRDLVKKALTGALGQDFTRTPRQ